MEESNCSYLRPLSHRAHDREHIANGVANIKHVGMMDHVPILQLLHSPPYLKNMVKSGFENHVYFIFMHE